MWPLDHGYTPHAMEMRPCRSGFFVLRYKSVAVNASLKPNSNDFKYSKWSIKIDLYSTFCSNHDF